MVLYKYRTAVMNEQEIKNKKGGVCHSLTDFTSGATMTTEAVAKKTSIKQRGQK